MLFNQNRTELRRYFFEVWQKFQAQQPLEILEQQILTIMIEHPEYHFIFNAPEKYLGQDFFPELGDENPFLHLSLHLSIREQVNTNRPAGIKKIYQDFLHYFQGNYLEVEHHMMQCLADMLWLAQKNQVMPDEKVYLEQLKNALKKQ